MTGQVASVTSNQLLKKATVCLDQESGRKKGQIKKVGGYLITPLQ